MSRRELPQPPPRRARRDAWAAIAAFAVVISCLTLLLYAVAEASFR